MVTDERRDQHESREDDQRQREPAVEPPRLQARPVVEEADDLAPLVGVGADGPARTGVADLRPAAVADEAPLAVELVRPELLTLGAFPGVEVTVVAEAGGAVSLGAAARVAGEYVQCTRGGEER